MLACEAATPAFRMDSVWLLTSAAPSFAPAPRTLVYRAASLADAPYMFNAMVIPFTASPTSILEASARISACSVTSFNPSRSFNSSGLAEPTMVNASTISCELARMRTPVVVMVVASPFACSVNHAISSSPKPVNDFKFAWLSSNLRRWSMNPFKAKVIPVTAANPAAKIPMYLLAPSAILEKPPWATLFSLLMSAISDFTDFSCSCSVFHSSVLRVTSPLLKVALSCFCAFSRSLMEAPERLFNTFLTSKASLAI